MKNWLRLLQILVLVELLGASLAIAFQMSKPAPQRPETRLLDPVTDAELTQLAQKVRTGNDSDWLALADMLVGKGFYTHAEQSYRQAHELNPANIEALSGLAFCLDRTGRLDDSDQLYQKLVKLTTGEVKQQHLYALGRNSLRAEKPQQAELYFQQNLDFFPARLMYCKLLVKHGRADQALPLIQQSLQLLPRSLLFQNIDREASLQLGQTEPAQTAADAMERSLLLFPINLHTDLMTERDQQSGFRGLYHEYENYASYLSPEQRRDTILELLKHLGETPSTYQTALITDLAQTASELNDLPLLKQSLLKLSDNGTHNATTKWLTGAQNRLAGNDPAAIELWEDSLQMTPNPERHRQLAELYASHGDKTKATKHFAQSLFLEGQQAFWDDSLEKSRELLEQSVSLDPQNATSWLYLGEAKRLLKQPEQAQLAYQNCLNLTPHNTRAQKGLARLSLKN